MRRIRVVSRIVYILFFKSLRLTSTLIVLYALAIGALYPTSDFRQAVAAGKAQRAKPGSQVYLNGHAVRLCGDLLLDRGVPPEAPPGAAEESMARPPSPE